MIIGGDFFDFWFDYSGYVPFEYIDMFEKLKKLKRSGVDIYYVLGNHDYWDFGFFKRNFSTETISDEFRKKFVEVKPTSVEVKTISVEVKTISVEFLRAQPGPAEVWKVGRR